jgi:ribosomal protein S18 acetylase RimI-like enzyme
MNYELVLLSELEPDGLKSLAALHHSVMPTLLSDLGLPIVLRYYQVAQNDPSVIGVCAVAPSGELLGWALGSPHPEQLNSNLRTPLVWFLFQMLRLVFTRPLVLWQLAASVLNPPGQQEMASGAIELTYIGVALQQRDRGLGKALLNAFVEASRSRGYRSVLLSVETLNSPAISLYQKAGFRIISTYSEGRFQRYRMELALA